MFVSDALLCRPNGKVEIEIYSHKPITYTIKKQDGNTITTNVESSTYHYKSYTVEVGSNMVFNIKVNQGIIITIKVKEGTRGVHCNYHIKVKTGNECEGYGTSYYFRLPAGDMRTEFGTYPSV